VARILIIGCGGRGQALARDLVADGHAVRGTTRSPERAAAIEAAGAEAYVGDPDVVGTLMGALDGVTIACWLLATADNPELHAGRLRMFCEKLVDTPVRGLVYEAGGGEAIVRDAERIWNIPLAVLGVPPSDCEMWQRAARSSVLGLLG
jgi:NAD(P)-dependent dehydrogenase (short-subunit alcohol dehydrogenase family)